MLQMCSFDGSKSTKGASKLRRDLINAEIGNLRDLLPLPSSTRQRLSQLQLMALVCVYVRKSNYFQQVFRKLESSDIITPNFGFSKALSGFLMMMTQNGKLLYISDNAAEYLGHSMEDLLIHGDSVYDIIDKQDHAAVQSELLRGPPGHHPHHHHPHWEERMFLCRMNVSRNARRQMRFGDQKVVLIRGHFLSFLPLCSRNEPVFLATCTPVAMPETRECVVQGTTAIFTSLHSMDMKFIHIDTNGEYHLGQSGEGLQGSSWYHLLHWDNLKEAQHKHRMITQAEADRACIMLVRMQSHLAANHRWLWVHVVLQVKDNMEGMQHPVIVCTNQVLSEREAEVMRSNSWLYHYYAVHSKLHYFEGHSTTTSPPDGSSSSTPTTPSARLPPPPATYHPPPPPPPPPSHAALLLSYPLPPEVIHHHQRHHSTTTATTTTSANGHHHHQQQRSSTTSPTATSYPNGGPTYTRLDNCWPAVHVDGGGGGAATLLTHVTPTLNVNGKWRVNVQLSEGEEEEEGVGSPQTVPDIVDNRFNNKNSGCVNAIGEQHVPQAEVTQQMSASISWLLDIDLTSLPVNKMDQTIGRRCLCNVNTCLALCTCSRHLTSSPADKQWTFCCTSGPSSSSSSSSSAEEEAEEARGVVKRRRHLVTDDQQ